MVQVEVEHKIYLETASNAEKFIDAFRQLASGDVAFYDEMRYLGREEQKNHYFYPSSPVLLQNFQWPRWECIPAFSYSDFDKATSVSVRTRYVNNESFQKTLLVVKAALDGGDASNGSKRVEGEYLFPTDQDTLDAFLLLAGFSLQAKWSRVRESYEYVLKENSYINHLMGEVFVSLSLDRNAGYGYLAEVEVSTDYEYASPEDLSKVASNLIGLTGFQVMDDTLLDAMFAYYNKHWKNYYGTDKTFRIENG